MDQAVLDLRLQEGVEGVGWLDEHEGEHLLRASSMLGTGLDAFVHILSFW